MAELPPQGKRPARRHKPSRLRNEMRPESTDDERRYEKHTMLVPHSDTVIPEIQPEQNERTNNQSGSGDQMLLSPNSTALLERNAVKRPKDPSASGPVPFKLLSKEDFGLGSSPASSSPFLFSFGQRGKVSIKPPLKDETAVAHSATQARPADAAVESSEGLAIHEDSIIASTTARVAPVALDSSQHLSNLDSPQATYELPQPSDPFSREPNTGHSGSELPEATLNTPTSAQTGTRPVNIPKKTRTVKKGSKGRRALLSQQGGRPWPPRTPPTMDYQSQASTPVEPVTIESDRSHNPSPADDYVYQEHHPIAGGNRVAFEIPETSLGTQSQDVHDSRVTDNDDLPFETDRSNTLQQSIGPATVSRTTVSSYPAPPENSSTVFFEGLSTVLPGQPLPYTVEQPAAATSESAAYILAERHLVLPPPTESQGSRPRSVDQLEYVHDPVDQGTQLGADHHTVQPASPQHRDSEAALHETSSRGGPHRVAKPRKKTRTTGGNLPHRVQVPSMPLDIDRSLESLRVALIANQFRVQHENSTTTKHHEDTIATLRDMVSLQNDTIADWKTKHQDLGSAVIRLTDKARTNQKYAAGLQKDYEKLQKDVSCFQRQSRETLQEKIAEVENEKDNLRRDFEVTLDVLAKSQKNLKATVEELYGHLTNSEREKKHLAEDLSKQTAMYKEESRKRDDLEKKFLSSVQSMQRQLGDGFTSLVDKLEVLQRSIADVAADDDRDAGTKECLGVLHSLQTIPFLTVKDVQKAEGMLRFVHERVNAGLGFLSDAVETKQLPTDEIQTFVKTQLQDLRTDMLKYEDVVTENRKVYESNDALKKQLEAQQHHSQDLDEQITALQQSEISLKERSTQLERELSDLRTSVRDYKSDPLELELDIVDLHQQLEKARDDLVAANTEAEKTEQLRLELEQEASRYKKLYAGAKDMLLKIGAAAQQGKKALSAAEIRAKKAEEQHRSIRARESDFKNEIHRLTIERDEREEKLEEQNKEVRAAKDQLQMLRKNNRILDSELDTIRKQKTELETMLKTAQATAERSDSPSNEATRLKEQLRERIGELESKTRDYATLNSEYADLSNKLAELQGSHDRLQSQESQHLSTIESLRQEADNQISEMRKNAEATAQLAQEQLSTLQTEKQDLLSEIEQARSIEAKLNNAQTAVSTERDSLQKELAELRAMKDSTDAEMHRFHTEAAEEQRKTQDTYHTEIDEWNRRLTQTEGSLKEAEATLRRSEAEYRAKVKSDRERAEEVIQLLHEEYEKKLQQAKVQTISNERLTAESSNSKGSSSHSLQNPNAGNNRKKVNRQNHSVLNVTGSSNIHHNIPWRASNTSQPEVSRTQREDSEFSMSLFEEGVQNNPAGEDLFDDYGISLVDPTAEAATETQELGGLSMSIEDFNEKMGQVLDRKTKCPNSSSTDLTTISSEEMTQMQMEVHCPSLTMLRGQDHSSPKHNSFQGNTDKIPIRSGSVSGPGSHSSRSNERPISQANTASRMMPPPVSVSNHFSAQSQLQGAARKGVVAPRMPEREGQKLSSSTGSSSPDFMHPPSSVSKHTFGYNDPRLLDRIEDTQSPSRDLEQSYSQKRKSPFSQATHDRAAKKQRNTSQSSLDRSSGPRNSSPCVSGSPAGGSRSKTEIAASYTQDSASATSRSRSKIQPSSSSVPPRTPSRFESSRGRYQSRGQLLSSSQAQAAGTTRRTSSRLTGSNRNFASAFNTSCH